MIQEFTDRKLGAILGYTDHLQADRARFSIHEGVIQFLWNRNATPVKLILDDLRLELRPGQILTTTFFHHLAFPTNEPPLTALVFNREFYCIADHDEEVSCNGILFFGTQDLPIITIPPEQCRKFELLLEVILDEFKTVDQIQGDMLQMLLKRFIIICTRLAKDQHVARSLNDSQIDVIRQFNVLVDMHFRTLRKVKDYADLLHKSPKTLSNLFATYGSRTPQSIIQERVLLEAKRLILYTDKQTQEIAYDLGFDDPAYFSRFFKKQSGHTPSAFRAEHALAV